MSLKGSILLRPLLGAIGLIVLFGGWEAAIRLGWVPFGLLPAPSSLGPAWLGEVRNGAWLQAIRDSLTHYMTGLVIGSVTGAVIGLLCGAMPVLDALLSGWCGCCAPFRGWRGCPSPFCGSD